MTGHCFQCRWHLNKKERKMPCKICKKGSRYEHANAQPIAYDQGAQ